MDVMAYTCKSTQLFEVGSGVQGQLDIVQDPVSKTNQPITSNEANEISLESQTILVIHFFIQTTFPEPAKDCYPAQPEV